MKRFLSTFLVVIVMLVFAGISTATPIVNPIEEDSFQVSSPNYGTILDTNIHGILWTPTVSLQTANGQSITMSIPDGSLCRYNVGIGTCIVPGALGLAPITIIFETEDVYGFSIPVFTNDSLTVSPYDATIQTFDALGNMIEEVYWSGLPVPVSGTQVTIPRSKERWPVGVIGDVPIHSVNIMAGVAGFPEEVVIGDSSLYLSPVTIQTKVTTITLPDPTPLPDPLPEPTPPTPATYSIKEYTVENINYANNRITVRGERGSVTLHLDVRRDIPTDIYENEGTWNGSMFQFHIGVMVNLDYVIENDVYEVISITIPKP